MKKDPLLKELEEWTGHRPAGEQWWGGFLALIVLAGVIMAVFFGCSAKGASCNLAWNANAPDEQVVKYRITLGIAVLAETGHLEAVVILPDAPCQIAIQAINIYGLISEPASLKLSYVDIIDQGESLLSFRILPGRHVEFWPGRRFYKGRIQTPL